ncbi:MAG TPA: FG-GAP-like repeat-containing protein [Flavobacteriales bacterium]
MLKHYALGALALTLSVPVVAQPTFTDRTDLLADITHSGNCVGVTDMNGDGLDDIATLDQGRVLVVYYQRTNGTFDRVSYGAIANDNQWGFALGDTDNDGHKDLIAGGHYDNVHHLRISAEGVAEPVSDLNNSQLYAQCMNMMDADNDGWLDGFSCHDDGAPKIWTNAAQNGTLTYTDLMDFTSTPASDMSGNYGSVWTDFDNDGDIDLYIAKCRQGVNNSADPRRWDRLFVNDGDNNYSDRAAEFGVENRWQTWSVDFGDIDNDGDLDLVATNHDNTMQLFENDGAGHYTEITEGSGLQINGFFLQSHFEDFDNDGFLDLLIGGMGIQHYFTNNGDKTFTEENFPMTAGEAMHSFGIGDLNNDGFPDVFASYAEGYVEPNNSHSDRLFLNEPNGNHWFNVVLEGTISNRDAVGARVTLTTALGTQIREVRSGESYGIVNAFSCHFGLGPNTEVLSMSVRWPSGLVETWNDLHADQVMTVVEGDCISPNAQVTATGDLLLCEDMTLTAAGGSSYLWNTGATTATIPVEVGGSYWVQVSDGSDCTGQAGFLVVGPPDATPQVQLSGPATICPDGSVMLTSSPADSYLWSTGATTQSITVSEEDTYTVTVPGLCDPFTSAAVTITMLPAPLPPVTSDVNIPVPGTAQLTATGGVDYQWYDAETGGNLLGTGSPWTTPTVNTNTTFWCAAIDTEAGASVHGGRTNRTSQGAYHTNNTYNLVFTATEDLVIRSVKVYVETAGIRTVELVDPMGLVLATADADLPVGESRIDLDFSVPAGGPYGLRSGTENHGMWRDSQNSPMAYPFALGTLGAITGTTVQGGNQYNQYYYFYDWEVAADVVICPSERTPTEVTVGPVGVEDRTGLQGWSIYPNPADDRLTIALGTITGTTQVELLDLTGRLVLTQGVAASSALVELDLSGLARGGYTLRVTHANGTSTRPVVIR